MRYKAARFILGIGVLMATAIASAQVTVGENLKLNAGGLFTAGYAGDYGNEIPSSHGLNFGLNGTIDGSYYNPSFLNFNATPYFNQDSNNSSFRSLTGASGIDSTVNLFGGSHYPGTVSYRYDTNSTGTFGLAGQPDFTTHGRGQGISIGWSALVPDYPTLSVSYEKGTGSGTVYGTNEETSSSNQIFNARSTYTVQGFRLNGYYNHTNFDSKFPEFLTGQGESVSNSAGHDFGAGATHDLPINGSFYANFDRATSNSDYFSTQGQNSNNSNYTDNIQNAGASFHPTTKLGLFVNENYTSNLAGYLSQNLSGGTGIPAAVNLGSGSHSYTVGGGANYQITNFLSTQAQATYYDQYYFGKSYTGTFVSGTVNYSRRLLNMFSFSASVIESANGQGTNNVGFIGNVNYSHRFGAWQTSGNFSYAQNVQSILVTYTTSYYNYSANVHRRLIRSLQWTGAFNGTHSGLNNQPGSSNHSEGFSTSLGSRTLNVTGNYTQASGISILGVNGFQPPPPTPGLTDFITFNGTSYGGGISATPHRRLVLSATYTRAYSDTLGGTIPSHNNTEIFNSQLQYHLRRIGVQAGFTRFIQGISASGAPPANSNAYFVGISRWFDFF